MILCSSLETVLKCRRRQNRSGLSMPIGKKRLRMEAHIDNELVTYLTTHSLHES